MTTILFSAFSVIAVLLAVPTLLLLGQVVAACRAPRTPALGPVGRRPGLALLVPAHDEASGLGPTLVAIRAQMRPGDRLVVVADNCSDDTAGVAAAHGAEVVVRHDLARRGKGYALDRGMQHLAAAPPETVVIVDADCRLGAGSLDALAQRCAASGRPVQALYLMRAPAGAGLRSRIAEFAWIVKNQVRPLGYSRLGLPCQLMGTGMAFPWALLRDAPLASGNIVEDLQLGLALSSAGTPPLFCPQALVTSDFPSNEEGRAAQRTRWEHGHVATLLTQGPRLLWQGVATGRLALVAMALDLCVPPLASLTLALGGLVLGGALLSAGFGGWLPLLPGLALTSALIASILLAWQRFGRSAVSLRDLLSAPWYAISKLPLYARLLVQRQTRWVRTKRDDQQL